MGVRRLFRGVNLYLALGGLLSGAMIVAPIAYAANFDLGIHAAIYGSFVKLETSLGHGVTNPQTLELFQLPLHIPYVIMAGLAFIGCICLCFVNKNVERKQVWLGRVLILAFAHLLLGGLIRYMGTSHVIFGEVSDGIVGGFQREYLLHFFILYFLWRAWSKHGATVVETR